MTYDEILSTIDLGDREEKLTQYYIDEIGVLSWLNDDAETQKILFSDRFEIKKNGVFHNISGPAIKFKDGNEYYWIDGAYYEEKSEWEKVSTNIKRKKVINKIK